MGFAGVIWGFLPHSLSTKELVHYQSPLKRGSVSRQKAGLLGFPWPSIRRGCSPSRKADHSFWRTENFPIFSSGDSPTALFCSRKWYSEPKTRVREEAPPIGFFKIKNLLKTKKQKNPNKPEMVPSVGHHHPQTLRTNPNFSIWHSGPQSSRLCLPSSPCSCLPCSSSHHLSLPLSLPSCISSPNNSC